jgi:hypothetical protein
MQTLDDRRAEHEGIPIFFDPQKWVGGNIETHTGVEPVFQPKRNRYVQKHQVSRQGRF